MRHCKLVELFVHSYFCVLQYCGTHVAHSHSSVRNIATSASSRHSATIPLTVLLLSSCLSFSCYRFTLLPGISCFRVSHSSGLLFLPFFLVAGFSYSILINHFSTAFYVTSSATLDEWYAPHLPNFPHMALVNPGMCHQGTVTISLPSAGFEPRTPVIRDRCSNH